MTSEDGGNDGGAADHFGGVPGATPIDDISGLKVKGITTRSQLYVVEAENVRKATVHYLNASPSPRFLRFDLPWIKHVHQQMFGDVWSWAGDFRTVALNLGVPAHQVSVILQQILDDLNYWPQTDMPLIEQAARLHHRAVFVHPFLNGNGRWARMLANLWLRRHKAPLVYWPADVDNASNNRDDYLVAIRTADEQDYGHLIDLHRRYSDEGTV